MLRNYLITALRQMRRQAGQTFINLIGLSVGIACCLLLFLFVRHETRFDALHQKADHIYRLNKIYTDENSAVEHHAISSGMMGPTLVDTYPEIRAAVRFLPWFDPVVLSRDERSMKVPSLAFADRNLFEVFDFRLVRGNPSTALEAPMSIVLAEDVAAVLYGDEDPMGQTLVGLENAIYTVTGIVERAPQTSHLYFDALASWSSTVPGDGGHEYLWMNNWLTQVHYTFVELDPSADAPIVESRLPSFMETYFPERSGQYHLYLQPLEDVYLGSGHIQHMRAVRSGSRTHVYAFAIIGVLVLFVAGVNFVNLSTARASRRMKEVGIRKTLGATRRRLAAQFVMEAVLVSLAATAVAAIAVVAALPSLNALTHRQIAFAPESPSWLAAFVATALLIGFASGLYPALVQSRYSPIRAFRGGRRDGRASSTPRRVLVVAQFSISISLLIGTGVVYRQMDFVQTKNLGFEAERVIVLNTGGTQIERQHDAFTEQLRRHPAIRSVAAGRNVPGFGTMTFSIEPEGASGDEDITVPVIRIADTHMKETLGMSLVQGRFFSRDRPAEMSDGVVINETLARRLGWTDPVGKRLDIKGELDNGRVIGVVKDFHFESLHRPIDPVAIIADPSQAGHVLARVEGGDLPGTISFVQSQWESFESRYPFEYRFLDDAYDSFYESEQRMMTTLGLFAILAIGIGCLGLWGLASYLAEERAKEMGIRKVLGAAASDILALMSKETIGLVAISFVVASPASYVLLVRWLDGFAYRVDPPAALFAAAGALAMLLAVATVSFQAIRTAMADPVDALRSE